MTALSLAAQEGNVDSLQLLVNGGANVEAKNVRGQTALHLAALAQSPETVEVLLKASKPVFYIVFFFFFNRCTGIL
jgi:ankyrin repeat protein